MNETDRPFAREDEDVEENEGELVDEDRPDREPELVGELVPDDDEGIEDDDLARLDPDVPAAEETAVHVRNSAPGGTDDASDGYVDEQEAP